MSSKSRRKQRRALPQRPGPLVQLPFGAPVEPQDLAASNRSVSAQYSYSGPVPPPAMLAEFDKLVPGCAQMIMMQWQKQSDHRMGLEKLVIQSDIRRSWGGLACGFVVAMTAICLGGWLIYCEHDIAGTILAGGGLTGLVGTFVYGTQSRKSERLEKAKLMTGKK